MKIDKGGVLNTALILFMCHFSFLIACVSLILSNYKQIKCDNVFFIIYWNLVNGRYVVA